MTTKQKHKTHTHTKQKKGKDVDWIGKKVDLPWNVEQ